MHLAMPMLVNTTVPANEVDMSIELALMTSEMTSLAFLLGIYFTVLPMVSVQCVYKRICILYHSVLYVCCTVPSPT